MIFYSVDRIENGVAVLIDDDGRSLTERLERLPADVGEGAVLRRTEQGYVVDTDEESTRRKTVLSLQEKLRRRAQNK